MCYFCLKSDTMKNKCFSSDLELRHQTHLKAEFVVSSYTKANLLSLDHSGKT